MDAYSSVREELAFENICKECRRDTNGKDKDSAEKAEG